MAPEGDTAWFEGVGGVARRRQDRGVAIGPAHLTMYAKGAVTAARAFPDAVIVPAHFHGWGHFSEGRAEVERAFAEAGLTSRLRWLTPSGDSTALE